jgi:hypothetical protein
MVASVMVLGVLLVNLLTTACGLPPVLSAPVDHPQVAQTELQNPTAPSPGMTPSIIPPAGNSVQQETQLAALAEVPKWKRYEVTLSNPSWNGNPFDLELTGEFRNVASGRMLTQLGFYAGDNTWKIYFMPDELGEWSYETHSPDSDLDKKKGSFSCIPSGLPGKLTRQGNRWVLQDQNKQVAPIILPTREWFKRTNTANGVDDFIRWADSTAGALLVGTTLVYFGQAQEEIPYIRGREGEQFNIPMWDRLNSHYDRLRDQGLGFYIMFYSDENESPNNFGITAKSPEELRLFRYTIARFSAYPIVMWDTGIDIKETRSNEWIDWFANWFNENDSWQHPVSSRTGGGSGGKFPTRGSYYSDGAPTLPAHRTVVKTWKDQNVPLAFTDRWRENYDRGNFDRNKIRRAVWEVGLVGGSALYVGGNEHDGYLSQDYASDFEAAPDLGIRTKFFLERVVDFNRLEPRDDLLGSGDQAVLSASLGREYVVYDANGGKIEIDLSHASGSLSAEWFNPRTGEIKSFGQVNGGGKVSFTSPDNNDWVLHLFNGNLACGALSVAESPGEQAPSSSSIDTSLLAFNIFVPMISQCG